MTEQNETSLEIALKPKAELRESIEREAEKLKPFEGVGVVEWETRSNDKKHYALFLKDEIIRDGDMVAQCIGPNGYDGYDVHNVHCFYVQFTEAMCWYGRAKELKEDVKIVMPYLD